MSHECQLMHFTHKRTTNVEMIRTCRCEEETLCKGEGTNSRKRNSFHLACLDDCQPGIQHGCSGVRSTGHRTASIQHNSAGKKPRSFSANHGSGILKTHAHARFNCFPVLVTGLQCQGVFNSRLPLIHCFWEILGPDPPQF